MSTPEATQELWRQLVETAEEVAAADQDQALTTMMLHKLGRLAFRARAALAEPVQPAEGAPSDDELRKLWRAAGGRFHGPNVETGAMPESQLLPFLRALASPSAPQPEVQSAAAPEAHRG